MKNATNKVSRWMRVLVAITLIFVMLTTPVLAATGSEEGATGTNANTSASSGSNANDASGNQNSQTQAQPTYQTGLYNVEGQWKYFEDGKFKAATGLVQRPDTGEWFYVEKGIRSNRTTITKKVNPDGNWYYVYKGAWKKATGLAKRHDNGRWYYIENGVYSKRTTITKKIENDGNWYFVYNGGYKKATGLAKRHDNGRWYYIENGKYTKRTTLTKKIVKNGDNNWYYVKKGAYTKDTGLAKRHDTGNWYYVRKGKYTKSTGVVARNGKSYYVHNGAVTFDIYNGVKFKGQLYNVQAGVARKAVSQSDITLWRALKLLNQITTKDMTKAEKLKVAFYHIRNNYKEYNPRIPHSKAVNWPIVYANDIFVDKGGNCLSCAAAMAYMAKAIGYTNVYACNSGGHGWAEINGLVYDPEWSRHRSDSTYFGISYNTKTSQNYKGAISAGAPYMRVKI